MKKLSVKKTLVCYSSQDAKKQKVIGSIAYFPAAAGINIASYVINKEAGETLEDYLDNKVFATAKRQVIKAEADDIKGFASFLEDYKKALAVERAAVESV